MITTFYPLFLSTLYLESEYKALVFLGVLLLLFLFSLFLLRGLFGFGIGLLHLLNADDPAEF